MKRKILALLCAATMIMGASMSVCAAGSGSVTANDVKDQVNSITSSEVKAEVTEGKIAVTISSTDVDRQINISVPVEEKELKASAEKVNGLKKDVSANAEIKAVPATKENGEKIAEITKEIANTITDLASKNEVFHMTAGEVFVCDIDSKDGKPVSVTLNVGATGENQTVYAFHAKADGSVEPLVVKKNSDGSATITMDNFSPVGIVVVTSDTNDDSAEDGASDKADTPAKVPSAPTSPKTADVFAAAALLMAAVSGTASAAFGRKAKKN